MIPLSPTVTNNPVELVEPSSLLLQEMKVKLKRNMEKMMSICLTRFPISGLGEPYLYHNLENFTMCGDFTWKYDVGINLQGRKRKVFNKLPCKS